MAKSTTNNGKKAGKGKRVAGLAAASAGAALIGAGAYYLLGPNKKEHQRKAKALFNKMKREAVREARRAKAITMPAYHQAVDAISAAYAKEYKLHEKDIKAIAQKLKGEWKNMKVAAGRAGRSSGGKARGGNAGKSSGTARKNSKK